MSVSQCSHGRLNAVVRILVVISATLSPAQAIRYARSESRIVDSANVTPKNKYPMMISIQENGIHICGGTIMNKHYVLTAAHCTTDIIGSKKGKYTVVAGLYHQNDPEDTQKVQSFGITKAYCHENYNDQVKGSYANDIAVLRLDRPLVWNDHVAPTNLPELAWTVLHGNQIAAIGVGWGFGRNKTFPHDPIRPLQEVEVPLITTERCQRGWGRGEETITDYHICHDAIEGAGSCELDSGGPLFLYNEAQDKHVQIGVSSFGEPRCGEVTNSRPGAWTKVSYYISWLREILRECDVSHVLPFRMNTVQDATQARSETRIVNGMNVTPVNKYPMMVQLVTQDYTLCGGTILDKYHVLTAAHCVRAIYLTDAEERYSVIAGVYHLGDPDPQYVQNVSFQKIYYHPRYDDKKKGRFANDIAVVRVRTPFLWNDHVAPTNIIEPGWDVLRDEEINGVAVGWGLGRNRTNPYEPTRPLQEVTIPLLTTETCQEEWEDYTITEDHACTEVIGGKTVCQGDSGGPLFIYNEATDKHIQIGIASWVQGGCGLHNTSSPSVWTKVSHFAFWIRQLIIDCGIKPNMV